MPAFRDVLYGEVVIPDFLTPFLRIPEFVRLRGIGLSNVDSIQFKDFNGPSRWEHGIAVSELATRCARRRGLSQLDRVHLVLAALLHDVATPPFAHTAEYVLTDFDHEVATRDVLAGNVSIDTSPGLSVFASELPQFAATCRVASKKLGITIDPERVADLVIGEGELGFLISGTLDLDNMDNVTRACLHLGIDVDRQLPKRLAEWLGTQNGPPLDLEHSPQPDVRQWVEYRRQLYSAFFESDEEELGRQAFLQHLMRRAIWEGVPRREIVWSTDQELLFTLGTTSCQDSAYLVSLAELTRLYRLLTPARRILTIPIDDKDLLRRLKSPLAAAWIERQLSTETLEAFVIVANRRWGTSSGTTLLQSPVGTLSVFKIGSEPKFDQLPQWLRASLPRFPRSSSLRQGITNAVASQLSRWSIEKPWLNEGAREDENIRLALASFGNWSFRLSQNESFHAYPSTFVHPIPAGLLTALGLKGELVLDPFGGTGQTAVEAIRYGGSAVSGDINAVGNLVARSRLTYLTKEERQKFSNLQSGEIDAAATGRVPEFPLRDKWHHPTTLEELSDIREFCWSLDDSASRQFALGCFSAILTASTGRKGEQHGFFADNTPLKGGTVSPPYRPAIDYFVARVRKNIRVLERLYSYIEKDGRDPAAEMARARVVDIDARSGTPLEYGVEPNSVAGIITSPPYLCTTDYALGARLSYYWLEMAQALQPAFVSEIGPRRRRFAPEREIVQYLSDLAAFAERAKELLRPRGFLAIVLGAPTGKPFREKNVIGEVDAILTRAGFGLYWEQRRPINWSRNHGYARLKEERIAVFVAPPD